MLMATRTWKSGIITVYVLIEDGPAHFLRYAAAGAACSIAFAGMMMYFEGVPFAAAYPLSYLHLRHDFLTRLDGVLLSPSSGLLVFVPIVFFAPLSHTSVLEGFAPKRARSCGLNCHHFA